MYSLEEESSHLLQ